MDSLKLLTTQRALVKLNQMKSLKYRKKVGKDKGEFDIDEMIKRERMKKE